MKKSTLDFIKNSIVNEIKTQIKENLYKLSDFKNTKKLWIKTPDSTEHEEAEIIAVRDTSVPNSGTTDFNIFIQLDSGKKILLSKSKLNSGEYSISFSKPKTPREKISKEPKSMASARKQRDFTPTNKTTTKAKDAIPEAEVKRIIQTWARKQLQVYIDLFVEEPTVENYTDMKEFMNSRTPNDMKWAQENEDIRYFGIIKRMTPTEFLKYLDEIKFKYFERLDLISILENHMETVPDFVENPEKVGVYFRKYM